jgi:multisubunit Na+/H+ antiporter MnhB subunit
MLVQLNTYDLFKATCRKNTAASIGLLCLGLAFLLQLVDILRNPYPVSTSSWFWIEDPSRSQAYASWAQVFVGFAVGGLAVVITYLQYKSKEYQKESTEAIKELASNITLTGGSARLSLSRYSKESIQKTYYEGDLKGTIEKIRGALLERADELDKDQLKNYVDSAFKVMDDCDAKWEKEKKSRK